MATSNRPKRVIVVDADNPMVEIDGEFFWREDHEAIVAAVREESYRAGFHAGWDDAAARNRPLPGPPRRHMTVVARLRRLLIGLALLILTLLVLSTIVSQLLQ